MIVAGKVAKRKSTAYWVAVKCLFVRLDNKAIKAVEATPWLKLSKAIVRVRPETLWPIVSSHAKATLVRKTRIAPRRTTYIIL